MEGQHETPVHAGIRNRMLRVCWRSQPRERSPEGQLCVRSARLSQVTRGGGDVEGPMVEHAYRRRRRFVDDHVDAPRVCRRVHGRMRKGAGFVHGPGEPEGGAETPAVRSSPYGVQEGVSEGYPEAV